MDQHVMTLSHSKIRFNCVTRPNRNWGSVTFLVYLLSWTFVSGHGLRICWVWGSTDSWADAVQVGLNYGLDLHHNLLFGIKTKLLYAYLSKNLQLCPSTIFNPMSWMMNWCQFQIKVWNHPKNPDFFIIIIKLFHV